MTDRCDAASRRTHDYSSADTACEPTHEEKATSEVASQQATEREAEARRNAYFASGADEGGRSRRASSDPGAFRTSTPDDKTARVIANAMKYDHPIQDDPLGNALVGMVGGGIIGGVEAGAGKVGLAGARGTFMKPLSRELVKKTVKGESTGAAAFAKGAAAGAKGTAIKAGRNAALGELPTAAKALVDATNLPAGTSESAGPPPPPPAGRSSTHGASVPVKEPNQSSGPRIPELLPDAVAPVRIQG